jgi:pyruvate-formate lyase
MKGKKLKPETHRLASQALDGVWGSSLSEQKIQLPLKSLFQSNYLKYGHGIVEIAKKSPLRILPTELIIGAATLKAASEHRVPIYLGKNTLWQSISHTTLNFGRILNRGLNAVIREVNERLLTINTKKERNLLHSYLLCAKAIIIWKNRHIKELNNQIEKADPEKSEAFQKLKDNLVNIPENPPETFYQAVQGLWFLFSFQRLCGNWPGIGRIDQILYSYLKKDIDNNQISIDEAREILAHFWIKGCDWIGASGFDNGSGDAQHYQNIVLGGTDPQGKDVSNLVTHLILEIVEELKISDFPIAVRVDEKSTPKDLWKKIAAVQKIGGGIVGIYNESLITHNLSDAGYLKEDIVEYANDGCWELIIPGRTAFTYIPIDIYQVFQATAGIIDQNKNTEPANYTTYEDFNSTFLQNLGKQVEKFHKQADKMFSNTTPSSLVDLFQDDCITNARSYNNKGCRYTVVSPHAGGLIDTGNSLYILKKVVFEEKLIGFQNFISIVKNNWNGEESLRAKISSQYPLFGNDLDEVDKFTKDLLNNFVKLVSNVKDRNGVLRPPGISTFGRQIEWAEGRGASLMGNLKGEYLSSNCSPTPGTDREGATSVINSHCKLDLTEVSNGTALDLKIDTSILQGEKGSDILIALMKTFLEKGGIFMHVDVMDNSVLLKAQQNPGKYPYLSVRVSGWSARFITLGSEWQNMIIERTLQKKS